MEREEFVKTLAERLRIDTTHAETAVNMTIAEIVSPFIFKRPGGEVGFLDNSCTNNCKAHAAPFEELPQQLKS